MRKVKFLLFGLAASMLTSCASYKAQYRDKANATAQQAKLPSETPVHTIYLIGDAGGSPKGDVAPGVKLLGEKLKNAAEETTVVYLGDNIYPNGLAPKSLIEERTEDEHKLRAQLGIVKDFPGNVYFVAGNHDWYRHGLEGVKRQKDFIEEYLDREDVLLPDPGCGDPEEIELSENLVLVLIDSQWWLENWRGETEINVGCEVKSRKDFKRFFEEAIKGNRNKNIVVAMHHPLYTYGPHGGHYQLKDHFFPLTSVGNSLWLPMPVIGSIFPFYRAAIGSKQDVAHPDYQSLKSTVIGSARKNGSFIFAAGHEHNLQYIERDDQTFIVSGAGSKRTPVGLGNGAEFAYGQSGFSQLDFYADGSAWVTFWTIDDPGGRIVFQKQIKAALPVAEKDTTIDFSAFKNLGATTTRPMATYDFQRGKFWRFLFGDHYRDTYATEIEVPVLDVTAYAGGLTPIKLGGGYQTNSLRMKDPQDREYSIRSIEKDATRTLPYPFGDSFVRGIVKDNFSAAHPMAAVPVARLSDAVNIHHTDPEIFYVPKQPGLETFNEVFGDAMYQLEKRPDKEWTDAPNFGKADDMESTLDVVEEMLEDKDVRIDYRTVVRARIFDNLIGDWDRHDDQWRWREVEEGDQRMFTPIPRDRDQAFSRYDGTLVAFIRQFTGVTKQFRSYSKAIKNIKWSNYNARNFDPTFLNASEWSVWEEEARYLQTKLTDEVIEQAFRKAFPPPVYQQDAEWIMSRLKARRDNLLDIARRLYEFVSDDVDVMGTDGRELFVVERLNDDSTRVSVFDTNKEGEREALLYRRVFLTKETKEIRLYGLEDEDIFRITGKVNDGILLRVIGGLDEDTFIDESQVRKPGKQTILYDAKNEARILNIGSETKQRFSKDPELNSYNRRADDYEYNFGLFLPTIAINPDDGLLLGGMAQYTTYGFKKSPYATKHTFSLNYALATSGMRFEYNGEYIDVLGKWDVLLDAQFNTPLYAINFYGLGNETPNPEEELGKNYNRVRQRLIRVEPALLRRANDAFSWSIGPTFESIRIDSTEGRFIDEFTSVYDPELFDGLEFLGVHFNMNLHNVDNPAFPTQGVGANLDLGWKQQLDNREKSFPYLKASFSLYQHIVPSGNVVFATRAGIWHNFNNDFEFFQGATLGGNPMQEANFRGLRRDRYTGKTAFYNNIDLRWNMVSSENSTLPFSLGIYGGFDHGRVWVDGEDSDRWHYAYGGGFFFAPFDLASVSVGLFHGDEQQTRFTLSGGFFF